MEALFAGDGGTVGNQAIASLLFEAYRRSGKRAIGEQPEAGGQNKSLLIDAGSTEQHPLELVGRNPLPVKGSEGFLLHSGSL
jgi:hypothetical protein